MLLAAALVLLLCWPLHDSSSLPPLPPSPFSHPLWLPVPDLSGSPVRRLSLSPLSFFRPLSLPPIVLTLEDGKAKSSISGERDENSFFSSRPACQLGPSSSPLLGPTLLNSSSQSLASVKSFVCPSQQTCPNPGMCSTSPAALFLPFLVSFLCYTISTCLPPPPLLLTLTLTLTRPSTFLRPSSQPISCLPFLPYCSALFSIVQTAKDRIDLLTRRATRLFSTSLIPSSQRHQLQLSLGFRPTPWQPHNKHRCLLTAMWSSMWPQPATSMVFT